MPVRFLADESCDFRVVRALREAGHDVAAIVEQQPGASDGEVIGLAAREGRLLLTEDRDFGQLVYARSVSIGAGVLFVRCPESYRGTLPGALVAAVEEHGPRLKGCFGVWTPRRLRLRRARGA